MAELKVLDAQGDRGEQVVKHMQECVSTWSTNGWEKKIAGFALVIWDERGTAGAVWMTRHGPISQDFMPMFVERALTREITILDTKDQIFEPQGGA